MKIDQVFIGNIKKCTKYETHITFDSYAGVNGCDSFESIDKDDEIYKENAILIKIKNGGYVDLDRFNSILDYIKVHQDITKDGYRLGRLIMSTSAYCVDSLFVDKCSLKPYYDNQQQVNSISIRQLKKQIKKNNR